jgi:hypothetical protein
MTTDVRTRITSRGVVQEPAPAGEDARLVVEVSHTGIGSGGGNIVTWAPFMDEDEAISKGFLTSWSDAVDSINELEAPFTILQIEADPWHDEVIFPEGNWTLKNTTIVGKVAWAQGGRNWISSPDFGNEGLNQGWLSYRSQFRGHQIALWVHPETNTNCRINGCVGVKDMFLRGTQADDGISGLSGSFLAIDSENQVVTFNRSGIDDTFIAADRDSFIEMYSSDLGSWVYGNIIEVVSANTVKFAVNADDGSPMPVSPESEMQWDNDGERNDSLFYMWGRMGGKESELSLEPSGSHAVLTTGPNHYNPGSYDDNFTNAMVGKKVFVSNTDGGSGTYDGEYTIIKFLDSSNVLIDLVGIPDATQENIKWTTLDHTDEFTIDNVDFRSNYNFGTLFMPFGKMTVHLKNCGSIRADSIACDDMMVVQTDGSPCWIGTYAIYGNGYLKIYALPGTQLNSNWHYGYANINFDLYQGNIVYVPVDTSHWNSSYSGDWPLNVNEALDQLAERIYAFEHP